jgi:DsbC/DsbD-like thiol-disulfide interchange protein
MMLRALPISTVIAGVLVAAAPWAAAEDLHAVTATPATATAGSPAKATVTIAAKNGWHLNEEAPISIKLTPGAGIQVPTPKLARKDIATATQDEARFDVAFTAAEPGAKTIEAEARYVICQDTACKQVKGTTTVKVDVEADAPAKGKTKPTKAKAKPKKA